MATRSSQRFVFLVGLVNLLVLSAVVASATPPYYPSGIDSPADALSPYDPQVSCRTGARPGAAALRELLLAYYPGTRDLGIIRSCDAGGTSEHKEGRAFDWGVRVDRPAEKVAADEFTGWLLTSDPWGQPYGGARRMGIMYMIWSGRIWGSYKAEDGWRTYTGANPHTDHVHFSMSWEGAECKTTWWQTTGCVGALPAPPPPAAGWTVIAPADVDGSGRDEALFYRQATGDFLVFDTMHRGMLTAERSRDVISSIWTHVVPADLDGDKDDEWLFHREDDGLWVAYSGSSQAGLGSWLGSYAVNGGWTTVLAADLDGNGDDELIFYRALTGEYLVYQGMPDGRLGSRLGGYRVNAGWTTVSAADLDGDGDDELIFYRAPTGEYLVYEGMPDGRLGSRLGTYTLNAGWTTIQAGDLNGDGDDELIFYRQSTGGYLVYEGLPDGRLGTRLYP